MSKYNGRHAAQAPIKKPLDAAPVPAETLDAIVAPSGEPFTFDTEERLRWALADERLRSAKMALQMAQQAAQTAEQELSGLRNALADKYSERGKYTFIGSVDIATGIGSRRLVS